MSVKKGKQENIGTTSQHTKYVVTRNGLRVSDLEYASIEDASPEVSHWQKILTRWPDGTKIAVEEYNDKKHRVY